MKALLHFASVSIALALELALAPIFVSIATAQSSTPNGNNRRDRVEDQFPLPPQNPTSTTGGGRRDRGACRQDPQNSNQLLTALSPTNKPGLTLAERPTFFVYVPQTSARFVEFSLLDRHNRGIYQTTFAPNNTSGLVSFTLPPDAPPLEIDRDYTWSFALICDRQNRLEDRFVTGRVRRINLDPSLKQKTESAVPKQRLALFQKAGIWYETLSTLVELQRSQPNDPALRATWREILQSGGLNDDIANKFK